MKRITELQKKVPTYIPQNNVWDNFYYLNHFLVGSRKISQNWSGGYMQVLEAVKSQKWGAGSPTAVTHIHRLSSPPPPGLSLTLLSKNELAVKNKTYPLIDNFIMI